MVGILYSWYVDRKITAYVWDRCYADLPAVQRHQIARDRQPQPRAWNIALGLDTIKPLEDPQQLVLAKPAASVAHCYCGPAPRRQIVASRPCLGRSSGIGYAPTGRWAGGKLR